jgi:hypothetical protein
MHQAMELPVLYQELLGQQAPIWECVEFRWRD